MTALHRRHKLDLARGGDRSFGKSEWKRAHRSYLHHFTSTRKDHSQHHRAFDLITARFLGVLWFWFEQQTRSLFDLASKEGLVAPGWST